MRSRAGRLMNLPTVSLRFNTKSQKLSVTHECLSANRSAATNLLPTMTSALPFHRAQGRTETGSADTRRLARRRSHPQHLSASAYRFFIKVSPVDHLKIPLSCRIRPVKYGSQRWGGSGWAGWKGKKVLSMLS